MSLKKLSSILIIAFSSLTFAKENVTALGYQLIEKDNHQIHLVTINPAHYKVMLVSALNDEQGRKVVSSFVDQNNALAGINAGYFYINNKGAGKPAGALKINNQWLSYQSKPRGAIGWSDNAVLVDRIITKKKNQASPSTIEVQPQLDTSVHSIQKWQQLTNIVGGIPVLIQHGKIITDLAPERALKSFIEERHARTAVCVKKDNHWLFLVASHTKEPDRPYVSKIVEGLTIAELAQFLLAQGCQNAINLDGGGSSTLVMEGKVLNTPAGDMDEFFHLYHERPVSDAILVVPK